MSYNEQDINQKIIEQEQICQIALDYAKKCGADECKVSLNYQEGFNVSTRNCEVENIEFNKDKSLNIKIINDHKQSFCSTQDLTNSAIYNCIDVALNNTKYLSADPYEALASADMICQKAQDFNVCHPCMFDTTKAIELGCNLESLALKSKHPYIKNTDGAYIYKALNLSTLAMSNGFLQSLKYTNYSLSLSLLAQKDGKMQRDSGFSTNCDFAKLNDLNFIYQEALEKTTSKLGARQVKTGNYDIIFTQGAARSLIAHFDNAINGQNIQSKSSFLYNKLNQSIFNSNISIEDDPHLVGRLYSSSYDDDGLPTKRVELIKDGVLTQYLLSLYDAKKLNMAPTGNAGGSYTLRVKAHNSIVKSYEDLLKTSPRLLVINHVFGQGVDLVSGNYSRGAEGFLVENGQIVHAVDEITIASNLNYLFKNICYIANDYDERYRILTPSLFIPQIMVSGS